MDKEWDWFGVVMDVSVRGEVMRTSAIRYYVFRSSSLEYDIMEHMYV